MTYSGALDPARVPGVFETSRTEGTPNPGPWPSKTKVSQVDDHYDSTKESIPAQDGDNYTGYDHEL